VIAIGGVTPSRVPELRQAGVHGVAVVGAIARDPERATTEFCAALG
jgi:thiamine monophosphate synthase